MKKIALSLSAATLIFSGLAGCGDVNDTSMNDTRSGYNVDQGRGGTNQTGFGVNNNGDSTGFGVSPGSSGSSGYGTTYGQGAGGDQNNRGYGLTENDNGLNGNQDNGTNNGQSTTRNRNGLHSDRIQGQNRGRTSAFEARENREHRNFGRGIVGDDQPGMVDDNGVLNRQNERNGNQRYNTGAEDGTRGFNRGAGNQGTRGYNQGNGNRTLNGNGTGNANDLGPGNNGMTDEYRDYYQNNGRGFDRDNGRNGVRGQNAGNARGYFDGDDGRLSREISDNLSGIDNIGNSHVIVHEDDVIVGVEADEDNDNLDRDIRTRVQEQIGDNRNIHVVTDRNQINDIRGMNDRLQNGGAFDEIGETFNDMLDDLGDAAQRPFERSR